MFLGKSEKVVHDNFIQAAHRIAGRYPDYFDPITKLPNRKHMPLALWASPLVIKHISDTMELHDGIIGTAMEGAVPFVDVGTVPWAGTTMPKVTRPQTQKALKVIMTDPSLMKLESGYSVQEAVALGQNEEELIERVHDLLCDKGISFAISQLKIGGHIQSHEIIDEERLVLEGEMSRRMTRRGQTLVANKCHLGNYSKIHGVRQQEYYYSRVVRRPRTKGLWEGQFQCRAACWLSKGSDEMELICAVFNEEVVREQASLWTNGTGRYCHQEGVFGLIYWFPDSVPNNDLECTLTLAVDLPLGVPTGEGMTEMWLSAEAKAFSRSNLNDDE